MAFHMTLGFKMSICLLLSSTSLFSNTSQATFIKAMPSAKKLRPLPKVICIVQQEPYKTLLLHHTTGKDNYYCFTENPGKPESVI